MWDRKRIEVHRPCLRGAICQGGNSIGKPLDVCKNAVLERVEHGMKAAHARPHVSKAGLTAGVTK
jgi:hypothetical protein